MITELTQEQIDRMPSYVDKWNKIGLSTDPLNYEESKKWVIEAYKVANLNPPEFFFRYGSPDGAIYGIYMIDCLSDWDGTYTSTEIHGDASKWEATFENTYKQYSEQFTKNKFVWNDDVKARMKSFISVKMQDSNISEKLQKHYNSFLFGAHDASWLSFYDFFHQEFDLECVRPLIPSFEIAKNCGWWSAYSEVAILQDRPEIISLNDNKVLHSTTGPAVRYPDGFELYFVESFTLEKRHVMDPQSITTKEIETERNAERRRVLTQQLGYENYFKQVNPTILDQDSVEVIKGEKTKMPRTLIETKTKDRFLIGTDGSTKRVYVMPVGQSVNTCKEAHQLISGLDESKCLGQS